MSGLRDSLDGQLILPGDDGYDEARTVWNAMVDRKPRLIIKCATTRDVVTAVRTARELGLEIGVRCGGHSVAGHAVPADGLMIDLTGLAAVRVDPIRHRADVRGGALLGALDRAAQRYGLATTAGNVSHTGVGGLTLGGGMGWLARQYGLTCDNVVSYEVVTAAGEVVMASAAENPELFWGLRGGGGNFGIVTRFDFRLHEIGTRALTADFSFPLDQAAAVLRGWRDLNAAAPRQATFTAGFGNEPFLRAGFVWVGDPNQARDLLPALRSLGRPAAEHVTELSYVDLQRIDDTPQGHNGRRYWKGHFLYTLPDAAIDALVASRQDPAEPRANVSLQAYGGAIAAVPDEDSAFSHRQTMFEFVTATGWTDPAEDPARTAAVRRSATVIEPFGSGLYTNVANDEGQAGVRRSYSPSKLARLTALKDVHDPDNVFHLNHNIRPSARSAQTGEEPQSVLR
jgi:FAD/FMN-containing dehydrogenase